MGISQIPSIEVDGNALSPDIANCLLDAVIDDDLYLPDMFELRFNDPDRKMADMNVFTIGATVEIKTGPRSEPASISLIKGEVTAIEAAIGSTGAFLTITGYDHSHRLHRGSKTKTFNDITDSDLAKRVAQAAGLAIGVIDPTATTHEHVSQVNESDWSFLQRRARDAGCRVFVKDGKLNMRSGSSSSPDSPVKLDFGDDMHEFQARMTANEQVTDVEVRGWDYEAKKAISQVAHTSIDNVTLENSSIKADTINSSFGSSTFVRTDLAIGKDANAATAAEGARVDRSSGQLHMTARITGDPNVTADTAIEITGTGKAFDGKWLASHSRHVFDSTGYSTHFTVSGSQDRSLAGLISGMSTSPSSGRVQSGVVVGIVTSTDDPMKIGRVKVSLPWLNDDFESFWARVCYPGAGAGRGLFLCPEIQDEVLIAFEHGDVSQPFIVGSLYNGQDKPDDDSYVSSTDGSVIRRAWTSRNGHKVVILEDPSDPDNDMINLVTKNGVVMNLKDNGELIVNAKKATFQLTEDFEIAAEGDITINGKNVTIQAKQNLQLTGSGGATIDGGPQTAIKGGMVGLN